MVHKNFIRLLALLLALCALAAPASADELARLAVEREVFDFLTCELTLSDAAACGVLANIEHESSFQPTVVGDKGTSYGLCQWHNERFSALRGYCSALGLDYRTVAGQMAYLKYELGSKYTSLLLSLQSIDNTPEGAYKAAWLWCIQFERPSNMQVKAAQRGELARGKYWPRYSRHTSIILLPEPEETQPSPEFIIEQLKQNPVTIPLPPAEEKTDDAGDVRYFKFRRPEMIAYQPRHLPPALLAQEDAPGWEIPALIVIGAAMILVVIFPTKKLRRKLYRRGRFMVR